MSGSMLRMHKHTGRGYAWGQRWSTKPIGNKWGHMACNTDGSIQVIASSFGTGQIFLSTDGGVSWRAVGTSASYRDIAINGSGSTIVAVSDTAVWVSTDYGQTWTNKLASTYFWRVRIASGTSGATAHIYLGGSYSQYSNQLYRSVDGGTTWGTTPYISGRIYDIALSADGSKCLVANYETVGSGDAYIYMSTNSGVSFSVSCSLIGLYRYFGAIALSSDGSVGIAITTGGYVYRTTNGGASWSNAAVSGMNCDTSQRSVMRMSADGSKIIHISSNYDTTNRVYPFTSSDYGATFTQRTSQFGMYSAVMVSGDGTYMYTARSGGKLSRSTDNGSTFSPISSGPEGISYTFNLGISSLVFGSSNAMLHMCDGQAYGYSDILRTTDGGNTFAMIGQTSGYGALQIAASSDGTIIYEVTSNTHSLYKSADSGATWVNCSGIVFNTKNIICSPTGQFAVVTPEAGYENNYCYYTTNYGVNWTVQSNDLVRVYYCLKASSTGRYVIAGGYEQASGQGFLRFSSDYGQSFSNTGWYSAVGSNCDSCAISGDGTKIYAATGSTLWCSANNGGTWTRLGAGVGSGWGGAIATNSTGQYVLALRNYVVHASTDYGVTWVNTGVSAYYLWMSSDATTLYAASSTNFYYGN